MKQLTLFLLILNCFSLFSQTKIDDFVSVEFPQEPIINDTLVDDLKVITYYVNNETETLLATIVSSTPSSPEINDFPYDLQSLDVFYKGALNGQNDRFLQEGLRLKNATKININNFVAYRSNYIDLNSENDRAEYINLVLNKSTYSIGYYNSNSFNDSTKNKFLSSIKIDTSQNPTQFSGNSNSYNLGYLTGKILFYVVLIGLVLWLIMRGKKKKK